MKYMRSFTAAALSVMLAGYAEIPAFAEEISSEKEEVIYVITDASGNVSDVEAVNIFSGGDIVDHGDYSAVKMLNTTDNITLDGDKVTFSSDAERVYYQGTMKNTEIPWNISIRYFLDGKEYPAEEIAGKSGSLEIHFSVSKNDKCKDGFYENYALQASFTLDTERCTNISADGATAANVGNNKQLSYTILPGKGIDAVIKADVTDFEMSAAAINGVRLNLNFEIDDSALTEKTDDLVNAVDSLDSGASELNSGAKEISEATGTLNEKVGELHTGVGSLTDGAGSLYSGLSEITDKNDDLTDAAYKAYEGLCSAAETSLNSKLKENGIDPVTLTPSTYSSVLSSLLDKMNADTVYQQAYQAALRQVTQQVKEQENTLYLGYIQSQSDTIISEYIASQADALYEKAASQAVYEKLIQSGYSDGQATAFLQSEQGKAAVSKALDEMTDEQRSQICSTAVSSLTDDQKEQIIQGALASLTDEQKKQIRDAYIQQMMSSDEVTSRLNEAVAAVNSAAEQISALKEQLDGYGTFYSGLSDYTAAVSSAESGADTLKQNMDKLYDSTGTLQTSVGKLNDAIGELYDGTQKLYDGTSEFADRTSNIDTQISDEINSITSSISGDDSDTVSFISDKNSNVDSVQFIIKTEAIEKPEAAESAVSEEETLTFWQKLLRLFGLY